MKRTLIWILTLCLLVGCGAQETEEEPPVDEPSLQETAPVELSDAYILTTEWETYAPNVEEIYFTVQNNSGTEAETGSDYRLERLEEDGTWAAVPFREDIGWDAILYILPEGGTKTFVCWMGAFDAVFSDGTYRIVKNVGDAVCAGEFTISADAPDHYGPALEDLPETYDADAGLADGAAVFTDAGAEQLETVDTFVEKVSMKIPCQLRVVQAYNENIPMVTDVIYEDDRFHWTMRQGDMYFEQWFSYLLTDGVDLYLGNSAAWDYDGDQRTLLVPESSAASIARVEDMTACRLEDNVIRYKVWSADGTKYAGIAADPMEFFYGVEGWGQMDTVASFELPEDFTGLKLIRWVDNDTFRLTDGKGWSADVDVEK